MKKIIRLVALLESRKLKTTKSFLIALVVMVTAAVATINVVLNEKTPIMSNLTLKNLEAFTQESGESGGLSTIYNRHTFQCSVYGNGKIQIAGGTILTVKGSLTFDGGLYCTSGGNATCSPVECAQLWTWILHGN
jgi:hypothetical protein